MRVSTLVVFLHTFFLLGCQSSYLFNGALEQIRILKARKPLEQVIKSQNLTKDEHFKLSYAQKAKTFARTIGLNCDQNFDTYVALNRPYVSYLLVASKKTELKAKTWWFPIVGSFPYKGFFSKSKAKKAASKLQKQHYDTYIRGVSAYSSLGWFREPILSSMLHGSAYNLADTLFHECFHSAFFIKNNVELNERLAVFFAHKILLLFLEQEKNQTQIQKEKSIWKDQILFSTFLAQTLEQAEEKFKNQAPQQQILKDIENQYSKTLKPKLKTLNYDTLFLDGLNNAKLVANKTYFHDFTTLESWLKQEFKGDIKAALKFLTSTSKSQLNLENF